MSGMPGLAIAIAATYHHLRCFAALLLYGARPGLADLGRLGLPAYVVTQCSVPHAIIKYRWGGVGEGHLGGGQSEGLWRGRGRKGAVVDVGLGFRSNGEPDSRPESSGRPTPLPLGVSCACPPSPRWLPAVCACC